MHWQFTGLVHYLLPKHFQIEIYSMFRKDLLLFVFLLLLSSITTAQNQPFSRMDVFDLQWFQDSQTSPYGKQNAFSKKVPEANPELLTTPTIVKDDGMWNIVTLQDGVVYKSILNQTINGSKQTVHIIEIDTKECKCLFEVVHDNGKLKRPSKWARDLGAFLAVNGNFFDPEKGGSVCYFRDDGELINISKPDPKELLFLPMLDEGAIGIENGTIGILEKPKDGWEQMKEPNIILSSGPMLVKNSGILEQENIDFMNKRHARTAIGVGPDRVFLVVVDGYTPQASGMSIHELSDLMLDLGSIDAINLDGGGSSTLWTQTDTLKGVLNYPPDNDKFDHKGERKVANALLVISMQ